MMQPMRSLPHVRLSAATSAALVLAMLGFAPAASAVVTTTCNSESLYDPKLEEPVSDQESTTGSCTSSLVGEFAALNGDGDADVGFLRSRSEANILQGPNPFQKPIDNASTDTTAQFVDTITVTADGFTGLVTLHATVAVSGFVDVVGNAQAGVASNVIAGSISQVISEGCTSNPGDPCFGSVDPFPRIVSEVVDASFTVVLGQATFFGLSLSTTAAHGDSLTGDPGSATVDFGGAGDFAWQGISSAEQGGTPIPDYSISSESGTDWTQPVPEPAALPATTAAVLAIAMMRRAPAARA
jgi:hypothetical protein